MSIEYGIRSKEYTIVRWTAALSVDAIQYILPALDAFIIVFSCLVGGISYDLLIGYPIFEIVPTCVACFLASFIYISRMKGSGYYELQESAKPGVELREILVCWFTTGLLLALIAFLLKVSAAYSRGAFIMFFSLVP